MIPKSHMPTWSRNDANEFGTIAIHKHDKKIILRDEKWTKRIWKETLKRIYETFLTLFFCGFFGHVQHFKHKIQLHSRFFSLFSFFCSIMLFSSCDSVLFSFSFGSLSCRITVTFVMWPNDEKNIYRYRINCGLMEMKSKRNSMHVVYVLRDWKNDNT